MLGRGPAGFSELLHSEMPATRPLLLQSIHQLLLAYRLLATYPLYAGSLQTETDPACEPYLAAPLARIRTLLLHGGGSKFVQQSRSDEGQVVQVVEKVVNLNHSVTDSEVRCFQMICTWPGTLPDYG